LHSAIPPQAQASPLIPCGSRLLIDVLTDYILYQRDLICKQFEQSARLLSWIETFRGAAGGYAPCQDEEILSAPLIFKPTIGLQVAKTWLDQRELLEKP